MYQGAVPASALVNNDPARPMLAEAVAELDLATSLLDMAATEHPGPWRRHTRALAAAGRFAPGAALCAALGGFLDRNGTDRGHPQHEALHELRHRLAQLREALGLRRGVREVQGGLVLRRRVPARGVEGVAQGGLRRGGCLRRLDGAAPVGPRLIIFAR
ncbi:hypothetical protein DFJ74DRAFT_654376 [Hyaloraphidium curvatum]|nr:hypothetical protein DFJ74DRAFT_654376 [Hyaloraphidium curvatum]